MKKYVHWFIIDRSEKDSKEQIKSIKTYIGSHDGSSASVFVRKSGTYEWIIRIECCQCYSDLEIDVNSSSTSLRRINKKPSSVNLKGSFFDVFKST